MKLVIKDKVVLYSLEDHDRIISHKWRVNKKGYVCGRINEKQVFLSRFIIEAPKEFMVDHVNNDKLDNRRENLRLVTTAENAKNKKKQSGKTSSHKGVYFVKATGKYRVTFVIDGKPVFLGAFEKEIDAAERYDTYIVQQNLKFHSLNFPEKREQYLLRSPVIAASRTNKRTCKYKGVYRKRNGYYSSAMLNGEHIQVNSSANEEECAIAFDEFVVKHRLKYALNFPEKYPDHEPLRVIKTIATAIDDDTLRIHIKSKPNVIALIDKEDYNKIKHFNCTITGGGYVNITLDGHKNTLLHRYLMNQTDPNVFVDHVNNNSLDNRRGNLRLSNLQRNGENVQKKPNTSSKYIGVSFVKAKNRWVACVARKTVGHFMDEETAGRQRDLYIKQHLPDSHYKMNFEWTENEIQEWTEKINILTSKTTIKNGNQ
jgi:hypothetical protein